MPLGIRQNNNLQHITLDIWKDQVFLNEKSYPAGYFAANILNQKQETFYSLIHYGGAISYEVEALMKANRDAFAKLLPQVRSDVSALLDVLWTYPPYCFLNRAGEQEVLDKVFCESMVDALMDTEAPYWDFFVRYLTAAFAIPLGIYHFVVAADYFERGYLCRLKERNETFFAIAAHDCFSSDDFWHMMEALPMPEIEKFTVSPVMESSYVFARNPNQKEKMVFVQRVRFHSIMQLYCFDLMNGLHHGHAPCVCQNCEHYFLTCNGHRPKYCGGMAPQDSRLTCRQYGAMMHQKEQNKQHPVYRLFSTRTNTIRKHHQRGKISDELRREALYLAETYRDRALMDNDYAAGDYVHDMEQETLYAQARARLAREDKP